jgi:UDP-2-acetamido-2-deoxy-ribo-hexuluronate aminotransferase
MPGNTSVYAQYTIEVDHRDAVVARLKMRGVPTAVHYPVPLHLQPLFSAGGWGVGAFPNSESAAARVLSLPIHPFLDEPTQDSIVEALAIAIAEPF